MSSEKASQKISKCLEIIKSNFFNQVELAGLLLEDSEQLNEAKEYLSAEGLDSLVYKSDEQESYKKSTLDWFHLRGGLLLSMRCLDEGVDIPKISHRVLVSSSQNPRTFIQRRGRVLRKSDDSKLRAYI